MTESYKARICLFGRTNLTTIRNANFTHYNETKSFRDRACCKVSETSDTLKNFINRDKI